MTVFNVTLASQNKNILAKIVAKIFAYPVYFS